MQTKRHLFSRAAAVAALLLGIGCLTGRSVIAQSGQSKGDQTGVGKPVGNLAVPGYENSNAKSLPKGGPPSRTRDGHVDLSGVWFAGKMGVDDVTASGSEARKQFDPKVTPEEKPPFQPWAAEKLKKLTAVDTELVRPSVNCLPRGVPGMFLTNPYPIQLIQYPGFIAQLNELNNNFRVIPTDGHPHTDDPDPTFNGEGIAHWDGEALVIDTIGIDERTWNDYVGWFHSDQEHVVEHLTRPSKNYLYYQVTIDDPKVLTKPWTSAPHAYTLGHEPLQEYYCTNNHEIEGLKQLRDLTEGPHK